MMLGGGGRKGNKEGDGGKGHGSPSERQLEFEEGSLRGLMMGGGDGQEWEPSRRFKVRGIQEGKKKMYQRAEEKKDLKCLKEN